MGKLKYFLLAALAGAALSPAVRAGVLATDGFETYNVGQLANSSGDAPSGGSGVWNGTWRVNTNELTWANVVDRTMAYDSGSIHVNGGDHALSITPTDGQNPSLPLSRQFTAQSGEPLYMSFLLQAPAVASDPDNNEFFQFGFEHSVSPDNITAGGGLQVNSSSPKFFVRQGTSGGIFGDTVSSTATYLIVLKLVDESGNNNYDHVYLFVDPDSNVETSQSSISVDNGPGWNTATNWLFRTARNDAGNAYYVDQFTLGDTFASVVPEPMTGVLMLLGLGGLMMWPRRRSCA